MCRWLLRAPTPLKSILWPIIDPILVTFGKICNFRYPNLVTFYFYELTHFLNWVKNTLLSTYSTNILVRLLIVNMKNCLTPKNLKMCDPILVTLLKMRLHYSQSSRENATPSGGTSPLASYKEVFPPPNRVNWPEVSIVWLSEHLFCLISYKSFLSNSFFFPSFDRIPRDATLSLAVFKKSRSEIIVAKKRRRGIENLTNCFTTAGQMKQRDLMYRLYRRLSGAGFSNSYLLHQDIIASQGSWALLPSAHAQ